MSTPKLQGLFLTVFDTTRGTAVEFEVPEGIATTQLDSEGGTSIFAVVKEYAIPKPALCGHLVTVCTRAHKVLSFPVRIESDAYPRGAFVWSVSWVFLRDAELAAYEPLVRKTGRVFEALEVSSLIMSAAATRHRVHAVIEQIYEDLNSYAETSIVLGGPNVLDLRLFPSLPNPPAVKDWDVPVPLVDLQNARDLGWDLTLYRIIPFINGVNAVGRIAKLADAEPALARVAVQHLIYFSCAVIVDLFQYTNSYALISGPGGLPATCGEPGGEGMDIGQECAAYVGVGGHTPDTLRLLQLYSKLQPGLRISEWIDANDIPENEIDVRRMTQFGVIKGFLRRVYVYPIWLEHYAFTGKKSARPSFSGLAQRLANVVPLGRSDTQFTRMAEPSLSRTVSPTPTVSQASQVIEGLEQQLDGTHHTDELCVRYRVSFDQLQAQFRQIGSVELVYM